MTDQLRGRVVGRIMKVTAIPEAALWAGLTPAVLPYAAAKATKAASPEATEAATAASRRIAGTPTHGYDAMREAANLHGHRGVLPPKADTGPGLGWNGLRNLSVRVRGHRQAHRKHRALARLARLR